MSRALSLLNFYFLSYLCPWHSPFASPLATLFVCSFVISSRAHVLTYIFNLSLFSPYLILYFTLRRFIASGAVSQTDMTLVVVISPLCVRFPGCVTSCWRLGRLTMRSEWKNLSSAPVLISVSLGYQMYWWPRPLFTHDSSSYHRVAQQIIQ